MLLWDEALSGFPWEKTLAERERNWHMMCKVSHDEVTMKTTLPPKRTLSVVGGGVGCGRRSVTRCINKYILGVHQELTVSVGFLLGYVEVAQEIGRKVIVSLECTFSVHSSNITRT